MRRVLLATITAYQRYLSPYKGFCCAYRVHTGRRGCSALGFRVVRRFGVIGGLVLLRQRTHRCGVAHRRFSTLRPPAPLAQAGFCDLSCDLPSIDLDCCGSALDLGSNLTACDCSGCDWPGRSQKTQKEDKYVHIPPNSGRAPVASAAPPHFSA